MYRELTNIERKAFMPLVETDGRPTVFVVDDDISIRESLEGLIETEGWRPMLFRSASEFLSYPLEQCARCLLLDINMPDLNGLELQQLIAADQSDMPIIFITGYGDVPMTVRAMKAGAVEVLTKPIDDDALLEAIRNAIARSAVVAGQQNEMRCLRDQYGALSKREREVMALVVTGLLNKQIAFELGISEVTVKAHRGNVTRKMNARSLPELVNMAARLGIGDAGLTI
ncbi:response regulator transcription factor [Rhizobium tubonense]|uniref:DNA-binding response regulator n=1 Tax=Rhizobium tubonense TaxID=484088 RepID=A0A2W4DHB5_9HYPH|nr:response regulator [Rhizobium tubonense]PZM15814.1 DNA-binding response regulator [Rhizobium tubonense]